MNITSLGKVLGGNLGELMKTLSELNIDDGDDSRRFIGRDGDCSETFVPENYDEDSYDDSEYQIVNSPKSGEGLRESFGEYADEYYSASHRSGVSPSLKDKGGRSLSEFAGMAQAMGVPKSMTDKVKKSALNSAFKDMEDRNNDWLAKQIREEERILRRGDLLDLGASHSKTCEARKIKNEHHRNHLAGLIK